MVLTGRAHRWVVGVSWGCVLIVSVLLHGASVHGFVFGSQVFRERKCLKSFIHMRTLGKPQDSERRTSASSARLRFPLGQV